MNRSIEVFVPRKVEDWGKVETVVDDLQEIDPQFVSVTMSGWEGAWCATRDMSKRFAKRGYKVCAHIPASAIALSELSAFVQELRVVGIDRVLALGGDGVHKGGYAQSSLEMVGVLSGFGVKNIAVGFYPDGHPLSRGFQADVAWLRAKHAAGARQAISQMVFAPEQVLRFQDAVPGVECIVGILPVTDWAQTCGFLTRCGSPLPVELCARVQDLSPADQVKVVNDTVSKTVEALERGGIAGVHYYTLNKAEPTRLAVSTHKVLQEA